MACFILNFYRNCPLAQYVLFSEQITSWWSSGLGALIFKFLFFYKAFSFFSFSLSSFKKLIARSSQRMGCDARSCSSTLMPKPRMKRGLWNSKVTCTYFLYLNSVTIHMPSPSSNKFWDEIALVSLDSGMLVDRSASCCFLILISSVL